ncbi:hypothetical protein BGW36DRAFT_426640 [Talaromyces proteolyticus]|uniref:Coenzyme Q-binding protein COQ10 START domain-containing protein n=1 Tax=Talaromyces proteolyticus TaxID=1131652 RepID=A0AAD4KRS4_9EURO|nr:uncharacterized protein BGW36DRAFT_426640 [Talaromyces proteolyticus]KAH8698959.1 hypothetical protein BGW36DRAFT_426640 [Talaromyces proteolyticus]
MKIVTALLFSIFASSAQSAICPILSTPSYGTKDAIFTACSNITIDAPADLVYKILTDFDSYHEWNTFVVNVELLSTPPYQVGSRMRFTDANLFPLFNTTSDEIITSLSPENTTAVWRYDIPTPALILAEHVSQLTSLGESQSFYNSWETYYRAASLLVDITLQEKLISAFEQQGKDLKQRAESLQTTKA